MYVLGSTGFIAHPKTGSQSARNVLLELGFEAVGNHHDIEPDWVSELEVVAATVRNPWDVVVSWYFHSHSTIPNFPSFDVWFDDWINRPNHYIHMGMFFGLPYATHVIRFENLNEDWAAFLKAAGLPHRDLIHINKGHFRKGRPYREFYNDERRDKVAVKFANTINQLGYTF